MELGTLSYAHKQTQDVLSKSPPMVIEEIGKSRECVYHAGDEFDMRWLIRVIFIKLHDEFERPILEWCVGRTDDHGVPTAKRTS